MTYNGETFSTPLTAPSGDQPTFKEAGASTATVSIAIPASDLKTGGKFPGLTVSGNFWNTKEDGSGTTPVVVHPLFPKMVNFKNTIAPTKE